MQSDNEQAKRYTDGQFWLVLKTMAREMRHEPTPAESALWKHLRGNQLDHAHFRRQHPIDRFVVDFVCNQHALIVEVDGEIHQYTAEQDAIRQEFLESLGFRVLRFTNDQVLHHTPAVLTAIRAAFQPTASDSPSPRSGEGGGDDRDPRTRQAETQAQIW